MLKSQWGRWSICASLDFRHEKNRRFTDFEQLVQYAVAWRRSESS